MNFESKEHHKKFTKRIMFDLFEVAKNATLHFTPKTSIHESPDLIVLRMSDFNPARLNALELLRLAKKSKINATSISSLFDQLQKIHDLERINQVTGAKIQIDVTPRGKAYDCSYLSKMNKTEEPNIIIACNYVHDDPDEDRDLFNTIYMNRRDTGTFELERFISKKLVKGPKGLRYFADREKTNIEKKLAERALKLINLLLPLPGGEIRWMVEGAKKPNDFWYFKYRFRDLFIKLLHDTEGRQSAVRMRKASQGKLHDIAVCTRKELDQGLRVVDNFEII